MMYDPDVISFLKLRNAPLTNENYRSIKSQMDANPELRAQVTTTHNVAEPSYSDKTYDGGLDVLGKEAPPARKGPPSNSAAAGNSGPAARAEKIAGDLGGPGEGGGPGPGIQPAQGQGGPTAVSTGGNRDDLETAMIAALGASSMAGRSAMAPPNGTPAVAQRVEPPPLQVGGASGDLDMLAGHAPPAISASPATPALEGPMQGAPQVQAQLPPPSQAGPTDALVTPGAEPRSAVVPNPDDIPHGMAQKLADEINRHGVKSPKGAQLLEQFMRMIGHVR